ncbi:unnamed protein product [Bursaphelenchus xylophilus]|uniref:(pine wood nematode) hypothetical protein n=1 Tax=Bursaphelenchus xylophilus TaxID=6326 RepID=A0A1I7RN27_BURXY|nr:unnamed protein product [Bursaphelenchus xylophilus]CAG9087619.1 unnamed protein product [Bursaphelenchus xylophilus]
MHFPLFYAIFIASLSYFCTAAEDNEDCAPKNFSVHPIEINAACSDTSFNVKFNSMENFYTSLDFGIDEKCKGDVNFQLQLDNCTIADIAKADIPGGVVLVVNKDVNNVISGNKVELELRNKTLKIKGGSKGFQQNSSCVLAAADTQEEPKAKIRMINSKNGCNVKVLLDPDATYHIESSEEVNNLFVFASNKLLIISLIATATVLIGLLIFVVLWYKDKLPVTRNRTYNLNSASTPAGSRR